MIKTLNIEQVATIYHCSKSWVYRNAESSGGVKRARKWIFLEDIIRADLSPTKENRQRAKYVSSKLPSDRLDDLLASPRGGRPSYMNNASTKGRP